MLNKQPEKYRNGRRLLEHTCFDKRKTWALKWVKILEDHVKTQCKTTDQNKKHNQKFHKFFQNNCKHGDIETYDRQKSNILQQGQPAKK